jgi:hypothetical protein
MTEMSNSISKGLELGFKRLVNNVPAINAAGYDVAMHNMMTEIINSNTLVTYLVATDICNNVVQVVTTHSIARYSAGFGGSNALHGQMLALLGKAVGTQLPMLVKFIGDQTEDLIHALAMEGVTVPSDTQVDAYFSLPITKNLMAGTTVAQRGVAMSLSNLCPIPHAWESLLFGFQDAVQGPMVVPI